MDGTVRNLEIEHINEMLPVLSPERLKEAENFISYLIEKQRRYEACVKETLAAENNEEFYIFDTAKEAMNAIRNWSE